VSLPLLFDLIIADPQPAAQGQRHIGGAAFD
jgi:hypothetical protein